MMWKLKWKELKPKIMPKQIKIGINQICFEIVNKGVGQLPREGYQRLPQLVIKAHKYKYTYQIDINNEGQQRSQKKFLGGTKLNIPKKKKKKLETI